MDVTLSAADAGLRDLVVSGAAVVEEGKLVVLRGGCISVAVVGGSLRSKDDALVMCLREG